MSKTTEEAQEVALTLCQAITSVVFHQRALAFSPSFLPRPDEWPALPARVDTAHAAPALIETASPDHATQAAVRNGKRNSKRAQPMDSQTASSSPPVDLDSEITLLESIVESGDNSDYVESAKN